MEVGLQVGFLYTKYDPYRYGCAHDIIVDGRYYYEWDQPSNLFTKRAYHTTYFGPTRVSVTIAYNLLFWKDRKDKKPQKGGQR